MQYESGANKLGLPGSCHSDNQWLGTKPYQGRMYHVDAARVRMVFTKYTALLASCLRHNSGVSAIFEMCKRALSLTCAFETYL